MTEVVVRRRDPPGKRKEADAERASQPRAGMPCAVTCAHCGREYAITSEEILAATWLRCPYYSDDVEQEAA